MAGPKQIGWSTEANLLWDVLKKLQRLSGLLSSGGGAGVQSVSGDGVNNTDPLNPVLTFPTTVEIGAQPLDSDLTAIAALSTASYGRSLLTEGSATSAKTTLQIPQVTYRSGRYVSNTLSGASTSTQALANGTLRAWRWRVESTLNFTEILSEVTTLAAASSYRIGLYTDLAGYPDQLVAGTDVTTYDSTGTGVKTSGAVNITLNPGYYWIVLNSNATPVMRAHATGSVLSLGADSSLGANSFVTAINATFAYAAMPSSFPAGGTYSLLACPVVAFKAA